MASEHELKINFKVTKEFEESMKKLSDHIVGLYKESKKLGLHIEMQIRED